MKIALLRRTIMALILVSVLLPLSGALGAPPQPPPPPAIPTPPSDPKYTYVKTYTAAAGDVTQIDNGTPGNDEISMYGGTGNVTQIISGNTGDDWLLQVGGEQKSVQSIDGGSGNKTFYQFGGQGDSAQIVTSGDGIQTFIQVGGKRNSEMLIYPIFTGIKNIEQYGGAGNNTMTAEGAEDDDVIKMYGGQGINTMTYNLTYGNDIITIIGNGLYNRLTINEQTYLTSHLNYKLLNYLGNVLFRKGAGGSTITVANLQLIMILDVNGKLVFTYNPSSVSAIITPLLLED
jgi:hypothetical protein